MASELNDVGAVFRLWDDDHVQPNYDPVPVLTRLSELVEEEAENYMKGDHDPFDERHPCRTDPNNPFGHTLKIIFKKELFMNRLLSDYLRESYWSRQNVFDKDVHLVNAAACRLMVNIYPGLETSAVFEPINPSASDSIVNKLANWAENAPDPLQTYATALLAAAMEVQDIANISRDINGRLIPIMLDRLHELAAEVVSSKKDHGSPPKFDIDRPFACFATKDSLSVAGGNASSNFSAVNGECQNVSDNNEMRSGKENQGKKRRRNSLKFNGWSPGACNAAGVQSENDDEEAVPRKKQCSYGINDNSNSSWAEMENFVFSNIQIYPVTKLTKQLFILKYLSQMGEFPEFLSHIVEKNALQLVLKLIDRRYWQNSRITFEALRYLAAILCHKKFAIEFINMRGLEKLLQIPRPGIAATGVSICLYYLSHCEDAMERICLLPCAVLSWLTSYALWLLECSHDSGRCHATMFFGLSFQFEGMLKEFDLQDGLRKIFNVLTMLPVITSNDRRIGEDEECSTRQIVRHVCTALKRYLEAHLCKKARHVHADYYRDLGSGTMQAALPDYKAYKSNPEMLREHLNVVSDCLYIDSCWRPVDELVDLGGINLMLRIIAFTYEWNYSGRAETVRSALDVIGICAVSTKVQELLCDRIELPDENFIVGIQIILSAAESEIVVDPDVQKSALNVLITCACAPLYKEGEFVKLFRSNARFVRKKYYKLSHSAEETIHKVWDCIRNSNGIMVLMSLIIVKTPITEADAIRALACQTLAGLARDDRVKQIISKLPLFTTGQLQSLMKNSILQEKRQEHVMFQKYALEIIERVSGKSAGSELEASFTNIHKANVVAQTKIQYNEKQLFTIIYQHLLKYGLIEAANALQKEANLPPIKTSQVNTLSPFTYCIRQSRLSSSMHDMKQITKSPIAYTSNDEASPSGSATPKIPISNGVPLKLPIHKPKSEHSYSIPSNKLYPRIMKYDQNHQQPECHVSLDSIITEYLTNQHALCKNPMITCPPFDLLRPHRCPEYKPKKLLHNNFTLRHSKGIRTRRLDEHLVHSRFCPVKTFRPNVNDGYFSCCKFLNDKQLAVGTYSGDLKILNIHSSLEEHTFSCHESYILNLALSSDSSLIVTSSTWRKPLSTLWRLNSGSCEKIRAFDEEEYFEFTNLSDKQLLGTRSDLAMIYDVETSKSVTKFEPRIGNQYIKNRATFSPTDQLVLSDGVLFDVTSGKEIHKFDKLNQSINGVFHPNGLEIISNTEVWDVRTYHLLKTVPDLDQTSIVFPKSGYVMYALAVEKDMDDDIGYETSFKTLDATDYSSITTIDVKKPIYTLACNRFDTQIALVENFGQFDNVDESTVRLYDVGRCKGENDLDDVEESDNSEDGSASDAQSETIPELPDSEDIDSDDSDDDDDDDDSDDEEEDIEEVIGELMDEINELSMPEMALDQADGYDDSDDDPDFMV